MDITIKFDALPDVLREEEDAASSSPQFTRLGRVNVTFEKMDKEHYRELMVVRKIMIEHVKQYAVDALEVGNEFSMNYSLIYVLNTINMIPLCQSAVEKTAAYLKGFHLKKKNDGPMPIEITSDDIESKDGTMSFAQITNRCFLFDLQPEQQLHIKHIVIEKFAVTDRPSDYRYQGGIRVVAFPDSPSIEFTLNMVSHPPEEDIINFVKTTIATLVGKLEAVRVERNSEEEGGCVVSLLNCEKDISELIVMRLLTLYLDTVSFIGPPPANSNAAPTSSNYASVKLMVVCRPTTGEARNMFTASITNLISTYSELLASLSSTTTTVIQKE